MADDATTLQSRVEFLVPLNKLPTERQASLIAQSEVIKLRKKQTLFKQGERDDFTFYLLEGELEMYADDSLIKHLTGGDGASFQPLAQLQPRQMSAIAKTAVQVLRIKRSLLEQLLSMDEPQVDNAADTGMLVEEMEAEQGGDWLMTLLQSELFTRIPPSNIQGLLDTLETISFAAGDDVVRQGEPGDFYYAIQSGACEVVRSGANKREIRLAELRSGATFGEEALISGARRNATVRMTEAGDLARLTKDDFTRLIKAPLLSAVTRGDADARVAAGAHWLDVRFEDEHSHNGLPDSMNIPLSSLRSRMDELDPQTAYVTYCDSGGRSSAAAFLLAEKGFEVSYVDGGAVAEPVAEPAPAKVQKKSKAAPVKPAAKQPDKAAAQPAPGADSKSDRDALLEVNARASSLSADAEKARLTIEKARQMMAEAEAMKREADRIVAEKLTAERDKLEAQSDELREQLAQADALRREAERIVAEKLAAERSRIESDTDKLRTKIAEAERLRDSLSEQQKAAEEVAAHAHEEVEQRVKLLEEQTAQRLREEEQRLEALYQKQTDQLESMQADRESELRDQLGKELAEERTRFEKEFLSTTEALERAHEERRQALAAKDAATAEAKASIDAFKAEQQALLNEQQAAFEQERERLKDEAARIEKVRADAVQAREVAEAAKARAEEELAAARARIADKPASNPADDLEIVEIEQRASDAERSLEQAREAESVVASVARENDDELERTYDTAKEINQLLEKELDDWVGEQDLLKDSTLQREVLSRQKEMLDRIKARAAEAKTDAEKQNQSLLDEIEQQLQGR